jgi:pyruvate kinase
VNLPGVRLSVPSLSEKDRDNAEWAARAGVDFVSLSFVRTAVEVRELSSILRKCGSPALVIAKIEKPEALDNLDEIVAAAGGVMVARGDLGVEIDVAQTPIAQKRIIETCTRHNKPVIVATQMLDSMQHSRRPTRAEASDVANAILDGADACMLSGETAIGDYPREAVEMMNRIMLATEGLISARPAPLPSPNMSVHPITGAIVFGAARIAERLKAKLVVVATRSGRTALAKAKLRAFTTTLGFSNRESTLRQMTLFWGIEPVRGAPEVAGPELRQFAESWGRTHGLLSPGDRIVIVAGTGYSGAHNQLEVHEVR